MPLGCMRCVCVQQLPTGETFKSEDKIIDNNFFTK